MNFSYKVIIPARYASTRLPGKPLLVIGNLTLIQHVYNAAQASHAEDIIIASDDHRIEDVAKSFGANVVMTSAAHTSGTDRISEVVTQQGDADEMIIVNLQGDEFGMKPALIDQVATALHNHTDKSMATLCEKITDEDDVEDPNVVKIIFDRNNTAIYFSRAPIPWKEQVHERQAYRHIGIYAYRTDFLKQYSVMTVCPLEQSERLEQLRAIYNGYSIHVELACDSCGIGINTSEDLEIARRSTKL